MTDKLYNGFREGRAPGDHKPNNQVRGMTQETMTKEQILEMRISCTCNEAYKTRQMADPDCGRCNWYEEILSCMDFYAQQQLSAERERSGKLVEALRTISNHYPEWDHISGEYTSQIIAQQTINEYDTATKEI